METKKCRVCKEEINIDLFYNNKTSKDKKANECISCCKNYYNLNKKDRKEYRDNHKEYYKSWYNDNIIEQKLYSKNYREENKELININFKKRKNEDPIFKLSCNFRTRISRILKENYIPKKSKSHDILGCTFKEFKQHLENKFEPWMTWDNYGNPKDGILEYNKTWDVDHIIPISTAKSEEDIIRLNYYTNFQPLCSKVNRELKINKLYYGMDFY